MKLYIFTEQALNDAIDNTIERIEEDNRLKELFLPRPVIIDIFIEQAEKSGHIIERNYFGELSKVNILQTLKNCFPKERTPPVPELPPIVSAAQLAAERSNNDFLFRKGK
jgi:hypothetical protein